MGRRWFLLGQQDWLKKLSFAVISTLDKWDISWFGSTIFEQNVKKNYFVAKVVFAQLFVIIPSDK